MYKRRLYIKLSIIIVSFNYYAKEKT
jgi:hypothetical protein